MKAKVSGIFGDKKKDLTEETPLLGSSQAKPLKMEKQKPTKRSAQPRNTLLFSTSPHSN